MSRLEPGCLALVIGSIDNGMVVVCDYYCPVGFVFRSPGGLRRTTVPAWATTDPDGANSIRAESSLMRLDGGEDENVITEQDMEVPA